MSGPGLMDWINSITVDGKPFDFLDVEVEKAYCPHPINRGLAQNIDTVMFAQEMNKRPWLDKELQYRFLLGSVVKKKRYGKWAKKLDLPNQDILDAVMEVYQCSLDKAIQYVSIMPEAEIEKVKAQVFRGGSDKVRGKKS